MADNSVNFTINVQGNAQAEVKQLNAKFYQLNQTAEGTKSLFAVMRN